MNTANAITKVLQEENATLRRLLWAMVRQLALWPGAENPESFPCMKDARAALEDDPDDLEENPDPPEEGPQ